VRPEFWSAERSEGDWSAERSEGDKETVRGPSLRN